MEPIERRIQDILTDNARLPLVFVLDTSSSMLVTRSGTPTGKTIVLDGRQYRAVLGGETRLDRLRHVTNTFLDALYGDENTRQAVEAAFVTCGDGVSLLSDFMGVDRGTGRIPLPKLTVGNKTMLGEGVLLALSLLAEKLRSYQAAGLRYYHPWLVVMTDGEDNGSPDALAQAKDWIYSLTNQRALTVYPFFMGEKPAKTALTAMLPHHHPIPHNKKQIQGMFRFVSAVVPDRERMGEKGISLGGFTVETWEQPL